MVIGVDLLPDEERLPASGTQPGVATAEGAPPLGYQSRPNPLVGGPVTPLLLTSPLPLSCVGAFGAAGPLGRSMAVEAWPFSQRTPCHPLGRRWGRIVPIVPAGLPTGSVHLDPRVSLPRVFLRGRHVEPGGIRLFRTD